MVMYNLLVYRSAEVAVDLGPKSHAKAIIAINKGVH